MTLSSSSTTCPPAGVEQAVLKLAANKGETHSNKVRVTNLDTALSVRAATAHLRATFGRHGAIARTHVEPTTMGETNAGWGELTFVDEASADAARADVLEREGAPRPMCTRVPMDDVQAMGFKYDDEDYTILSAGTKVDLVFDVAGSAIHAGILFHGNKFRAMGKDYDYCLIHRAVHYLIMVCSNSEEQLTSKGNTLGLMAFYGGEYVKIPMGETAKTVHHLIEPLNRLQEQPFGMQARQQITGGKLAPDGMTNCLDSAVTILDGLGLVDDIRNDIVEKLLPYMPQGLGGGGRARSSGDYQFDGEGKEDEQEDAQATMLSAYAAISDELDALPDGWVST
jgi:hypothetical protein